MNKPNINAEVLPLPDGHRWVDIANEPFTRNARFWCGFWTDDYASSTTEYRQDWSYCIPIEQS